MGYTLLLIRLGKANWVASFENGNATTFNNDINPECEVITLSDLLRMRDEIVKNGDIK